MHLRSNAFRPYEHLHPRLAFGTYDADTHVRLSENKNPHLAWSCVPEGTRSLVLLCFDADVPTEGTDVNQADRTVPIDLSRADFFHWVTVDLPASLREIAEGSHCDGITAKGKPTGATPDGGLQGVNDYTSWFASDPDMAGKYGGYDGPCPPWNDERVHGYHFVIYALDVATLGLSGAFTGPDVRAAMAGHVLDSAELVGLYNIYPGARA